MDRNPQILTLILIKGQRIAPKFLCQWRSFCSPEVLATFPGGSRANRQGGRDVAPDFCPRCNSRNPKFVLTKH